MEASKTHLRIIEKTLLEVFGHHSNLDIRVVQSRRMSSKVLDHLRCSTIQPSSALILGPDIAMMNYNFLEGRTCD